MILQGDDEHPPYSDATFLWITDQPELNEQTRKKMLSTSSVLSNDTLRVIDVSFDNETLFPGTVHFLNTQKLGKDKSLVTRNDHRTYTIWDIIRNTIDTRPGRVFVIVDEAHRGMTEERSQAEATTIIQKFIKGSPELSPIPVVVGISATPARFNALISGTSRINRPVDIDVSEVRASGLIKDAIVLHHPKREQPTDMTMLREATRMLKAFTAKWSHYCATQSETDVVPLLVVQVEDSHRKGEISQTDIPEAMRMVRDVLGAVPNDAFAHSFQESMSIRIDGEELRYIAPSDIQNDRDVRVVFFKTSLNTGWDCPRAEVMMSFRKANDATYIAQLVGRMVRTPLARRIIDDDVLNTVALFLPHYDAKGVRHIVDKLTAPDSEIIAPVDIEDGDDAVELVQAKRSSNNFELLSTLPSYIVPRRRKASQIRRLMKFARLLAHDDLDEEATDTAEEKLIGVLDKAYNQAKKTKRFKEIVEERAQIEIEAVNWEFGSDSLTDGHTVSVDIASENVDDLFDATGRKLSDGLHKKWWRRRVQQDRNVKELAKLELFALCIEPRVIANVESAAGEVVQEWLTKHSKKILKMEEARQSAYSEVRQLACEPELTPLVYPATIRGRKADTVWTKHLYVREDGKYPADFNKPESKTLESEIGKKSVQGWLRNTDRKPWALCIPYDWKGEKKAMYPDFVIIRSEDGDLTADILEPHAIGFADGPAKAAGLAQFADKHWDRFGRISLILLDGEDAKEVDLANERMRNRVKAFSTIAELQNLFNEL